MLLGMSILLRSSILPLRLDGRHLLSAGEEMSAPLKSASQCVHNVFTDDLLSAVKTCRRYLNVCLGEKDEKKERGKIPSFHGKNKKLCLPDLLEVSPPAGSARGGRSGRARREASGVVAGAHVHRALVRGQSARVSKSKTLEFKFRKLTVFQVASSKLVAPGFSFRSKTKQ